MGNRAVDRRVAEIVAQATAATTQRHNQDRAGDTPTGASSPAPSYEHTDAWNAEQLAQFDGGRIHYSEPTGLLVWDGRRWLRDEGGLIAMALAKETVRGMLQEAVDLPTDKERKARMDWARKSLSESKLRAMVSLARSEVAIDPTKLDADPWVLNVLNGTLDLRSQELRPHRRGDLLTKLAPVNFDPNATCPIWDRFLREIMGGNETLVEFVQRAVGYALTGDTREQVMFFLVGIGRNGKSTFLGILAHVLGDYAKKANAETFLASDRSSTGPREDLARLAGARFVTAIEVDKGRRLAEAMLKEATGGDAVTARYLFKHEFEFLPQFKLFFAANHRPVVRGTDDGIWRRFRLIPFDVQIPEDQIDRALPEKLRAEAPGILAWAVRGCQLWQRDGLGFPDEVRAATDAYRHEQDPLADFLALRCVLGQGRSEEAGRLFEAYKAWCAGEGEEPLSQRAFGVRLTERGLQPRKGTGGKRLRDGVVLRGPLDLDDPVAESPLVAVEGGCSPEGQQTPIHARELSGDSATTSHAPLARREPSTAAECFFCSCPATGTLTDGTPSCEVCAPQGQFRPSAGLQALVRYEKRQQGNAA